LVLPQQVILNWPFLDALCERVELTIEKEDKALLSRVGQKFKVDYELAFADCQDVQSLRNMMQKCRAALKITQEAVAGFEWFLNNSTADKGATMDRSFFGSYNSLLRNHCQSIQEILESPRGISQIVGLTRITLIVKLRPC